jgi:hypothetical protein
MPERSKKAIANSQLMEPPGPPGGSLNSNLNGNLYPRNGFAYVLAVNETLRPKLVTLNAANY